MRNPISTIRHGIVRIIPNVEISKNVVNRCNVTSAVVVPDKHVRISDLKEFIAKGYRFVVPFGNGRDKGYFVSNFKNTLTEKRIKISTETTDITL